MKMKAINKPWRGTAVGEEFEASPGHARFLQRIKRAEPVGLGYQTRMMTAEAPKAAEPVQYTRTEPVEEAPYGYKTDGTPRQRPGRAPKVEK